MILLLDLLLAIGLDEHLLHFLAARAQIGVIANK